MGRKTCGLMLQYVRMSDELYLRLAQELVQTSPSAEIVDIDITLEVTRWGKEFHNRCMRP
jgi:hypothetical protein